MYKMFNSIKIISLLILISVQVYSSPSKGSMHALDVLNTWNNTLGQNNLLLHDMKFNNKFLEFKDIHTWFGITDKIKEKDRFFKFATDKYGSVYYLWFYTTLKGEPPVVTVNMSDDSADNVTENINDFVCSLIKGETLSGDKLYNHKSSDFKQVNQYKKKYLETLKCPSKIKVFFDLNTHPKINEWLDKLDEKYRK